ncbi:MTRF1L release factor glutamine methyltransferase-like [Amphiura filiformis]|uniref:MTRF1L release factor glutamine methyltransferase-like n=1 Tax=Amphiura filiformis TaxID=82378 RepID=UPI003B21EACC
MPVQYIIGEWDFRNLTLLMRPPVFVPCPETEEFVELVLDHYSPSDKLHLLEVGCGTGAICISLLVELPKAHITVIEKSREACELTKANAIRLGVIDRLTIHQDEWGTELPSCLHGNTFDAIVSNPPYIAHEHLKSVGDEVRHMDNGALDGGTDGLYHIKNICQQARHILKEEAFIWLETDTYHSDIIDAWLQQQPSTRLTFIKMYRDFANKPRFCQLQVKKEYG